MSRLNVLVTINMEGLGDKVYDKSVCDHGGL